MERDNGLFTPAQTEGLRQAATGGDISAGMKHCVTTEITEPLGFKVVVLHCFLECIGPHIDHEQLGVGHSLSFFQFSVAHEANTTV